MTTTRPDLVNLPKLTNPTDQQTLFVVQDSGVNQTLSADQTRQFLGDQIGPTGPQGPQGVTGPQGPQGVTGPQGPAFIAYSTSSATPASVGTIVLITSNTNHSFVNGLRVTAINSITNFFEGFLTLSVDRSTFFIAADFNIGNITANNWTISLTGQKGATGPQGPQGVQGPTGPSFKVTSTSSATPASSGNITLIVNTSNHAFVAGQRIIAINATNNYFEGTLANIATNGTSFLIVADYNVGSTTANNWNIGLTGQRGSTGAQGPQGVQGPTGPMVFAKGTTSAPVAPDGSSLTTINVSSIYQNHLFVQGLTVAVINTNNNFFIGTIANDVVGRTVFNIQQVAAVGSTPASDWTIVLTGSVGPSGPVGPPTQFTGTATNLAGGTTGSIAIQAATSITSFISPGNQGNLLQFQVGTAAFVSTSSLLVGYADNARKIYSKIYSTAELNPNRSIGLIESPGTFSDLGVQASLNYHTNDQLLTANRIFVSSSNTSNSTDTGALVVEGGVGIGKNLIIGQQTVIKSTDNAFSTVTGALIVTGGVGIGSDLYVGGQITSNKLVIELTTISTTLITTDDIIKTTNNTQATSPSTGALQITGGAGIEGNLHVGGVIVGSLVGTTNIATNIAGGLPGQLLYQISTSATGFVTTGPNTYILTSNGSNSPFWSNNLFLSSTINAVSATTGALVVAGGAGINQDLYVGGRIYGTLAGPVQAAEQLKVIASDMNQVHFVTFVDSNNIGVANTETFYTTSSMTINPNTGEIKFLSLAEATSTTTGALAISGGAGIGKNLYVGGNIQIAGLTTITNTTNSFSPITGALVILGGVGIVGNLNVGGTINASITGNSSTATNIAGGTAGQVPYQTGPGQTSFYGPGTDGNIVVSGGTGSPRYQNTLTLTGITTATSPTTGALIVAGGAGIGKNLYVGGSTVEIGSNAKLILDDRNGFGSVTAITGLSLFHNTQQAVAYVNRKALHHFQLDVQDYTTATSTTTGAVTVQGGVGVGGSLYLDGYLQVGYSNATTYSSGTPGEIRATNEITAYYSSDIVLKENFKKIENPLDMINQISGYFFDWKDTFIKYRGGEDGYFVRKHDVGVVAQEIEKILPMIVADRLDGYKAVKYEKLVPLLIEGIKALYKEIEILKKQI
jgi:hypothetical protein